MLVCLYVCHIKLDKLSKSTAGGCWFVCMCVILDSVNCLSPLLADVGLFVCVFGELQ